MKVMKISSHLFLLLFLQAVWAHTEVNFTYSTHICLLLSVKQNMYLEHGTVLRSLLKHLLCFTYTHQKCASHTHTHKVSNLVFYTQSTSTAIFYQDSGRQTQTIYTMKHTSTTCTHCIIISIKAKEKWWSIVNNSHKWVYNTEITGTVCQDYFQCVILSHSIYEYSTFHSKIETNTHECRQHNHEQVASTVAVHFVLALRTHLYFK